MPGINLTREEARDRSIMVDVDSYEIEIDLTTGEKTFGSVTTVRFRCAEDAERTWLDFIAPAVTEVVLNGTSLDPVSRVRRLPNHARGTAGGKRGPGCRRGRLHAHRRGLAPLRRSRRRRGLPVQPVRSRRCAAGLRLLRATRPEGNVHIYGDRAQALAGGLELTHTRAVYGRRGRLSRPLGFRTDAAVVHLRHRHRRGSLPRGPQRVRGQGGHHPAGFVLPGLPRRAPRCRRAVRRHSPWIRLLRRCLRPRVPVREIRPTLRP